MTSTRQHRLRAPSTYFAVGTLILVITDALYYLYGH